MSFHTDCFENLKPVVEIFDFQNTKENKVETPPIQMSNQQDYCSLKTKYDYQEEFGKTVRILADSNLAKELAGTHGIHFASALWLRQNLA